MEAATALLPYCLTISLSYTYKWSISAAMH